MIHQFDEATGNFRLEQGTFPIPYFPIEGIFTRNIYGGKSKDGKYDITFLETSSPGLRGQSGGPIFDTKGTIWAIQSKTNHLPLGFAPKITKNGKEVEENQFLNVGLGVHPLTLITFLKDNVVDFKISLNRYQAFRIISLNKELSLKKLLEMNSLREKLVGESGVLIPLITELTNKSQITRGSMSRYTEDKKVTTIKQAINGFLLSCKVEYYYH